MAEDHSKDSLADAWTKRFKNNPIIAAFIVLALILAGVASLTESFDKLERFASRLWSKPMAPTPAPPQSSIKPESMPAKNEVTSPKRNEQKTGGDNSPAVADVQGDVNITIDQQRKQK
jgi:hypothetical protein